MLFFNPLCQIYFVWCFQWLLVHLNLEILDKNWKMVPKSNKTFLTIFQWTELNRICFPNKVNIQISMKFIFKRHKTIKKETNYIKIFKTFPHVIHSLFLDKTITPHQMKEHHKHLGFPYMQNRDNELHNEICSSVYIKIHKTEYFQQVMISVGPYSSWTLKPICKWAPNNQQISKTNLYQPTGHIQGQNFNKFNNPTQSSPK